MKNKINYKIITFLLLFTFFFTGQSFSEEERIAPEQHFRVEHEIGRQSVWTGSIPIDVYITPYTDFDKVEITFDHSNMLESSYRGPQFFPVNAGQTYKVQGRISPVESGAHHITVNAIAWEYNTNYTSSSSTNITIDENLQMVPQTQTFKILNVLKIIFIVLSVIGIIAGIYLLIIKNLDKIKDWLEPDY